MRSLSGFTLSTQPDNHATRIKETQIADIAVDDGNAVPRCGKRGTLFRIEHNGNIISFCHHISKFRIVAFATAERQVIVSRNVLAVRVLCVIIELHSRKRSHQIRIRDTTHRDFDVLPSHIAREIQSNSGSQLNTCCLTHGGFDVFYNVSQKVIGIFKEPFCFCNTSCLRCCKFTHARRIEAGRRASR